MPILSAAITTMLMFERPLLHSWQQNVHASTMILQIFKLILTIKHHYSIYFGTCGFSVVPLPTFLAVV
jgi:hypothetical protein